MKTKYIFLLSFLSFLTAFGQTEGITYQAVLVDNNPDEIPGVDVPSSNIPEQPLTIRFSILNADGNTEYQETQETQTDPYGTINLTIGTGEVTSESSVAFNQINWDGPKTLNVAIDLDAGTNFSQFSSQPLTYIPYVRHREIIADGDLSVDGASILNDDLTVGGGTSLENRLTVGGASNFYDQVLIRTALEDKSEFSYDAYPLQLEGSSQGMAIKLNSDTPQRSSNFMSFWNANDEPIGRIEGFRAFTSITLKDIVDIFLFSEPDEDEAEGREDDDSAPPADSPNELDIFATDTYSVDVTIEIIDLYDASTTFGTNLGACIGGFAVLGDCDDAIWSALSLYLQGVQYSYFVKYNEANRGVAFESGGADYAEWLKKHDKNEVMTFGDVVGVKSGVISKSFVDANNFMIVSKSPIVSGAMPAVIDKEKYKQIAFLGQVPVKVIGVVSKGDYILPSGNGDGMAIAVSPENMRTNDYNRIIGVAWDEYQGNQLFSYINTAVGINSNDLTKEVNAMQIVMNGIQEALVQVNPNYEPTYFDVNAVSVDNNVKTTKSLTLQQIMVQQYGLDELNSSEEAFKRVNQLMKEHDSNNDLIQFSDLPYLEEVLTNPTTENINKYNEFYTNAVKKLASILSNQIP